MKKVRKIFSGIVTFPNRVAALLSPIQEFRTSPPGSCKFGGANGNGSLPGVLSGDDLKNFRLDNIGSINVPVKT
jgi:hypothetical protein